MKDTKPIDRASRAIEEFLAPTSGVHGVLFYGAEGAPVIETAEALAKGWLCLNLRDGKPCGECRSCHAFDRGNHTDFRCIEPGGKSNLIIMDQIRPSREQKDDEPDISLQTFFRTLPLLGTRKVAIIEDADRMMEKAENALLKTLEEPHPYAKLILTTHSLSTLLPTIISRCVSVPVQQRTDVVTHSAANALIHNIADKIDPQHRAMALRLAEEFREACAKIDDEEGSGARAAQAKALVELAQALLASFPERPERAQAAIEAHRRIVGNGQAGIVLDWLFAHICS